MLEVRQSGIHNRGVFATKDIKKDTRIIEYIGEKITKEEAERRGKLAQEKARKDPTAGAVYIFELTDTHDLDGDVPNNTARLINHSCDPNAEARISGERIWIYAIKDIKAGEEILFNYGYDLESFADHPCRCGAKNCVGYILSEEHWDKIKNGSPEDAG